MRKLIVLQLEISPDSYIPVETYEGHELDKAMEHVSKLGYEPFSPNIKAVTEGSDYFKNECGMLAVITQWELPQALCQMSG